MSRPLDQPDQHHRASETVATLLAEGWPRFSDSERARRREAMLQAAAEQGSDLVIA